MRSLADLSLDRSPPLWVPLQFMITAPLFGMLFAVGMLWLGPDLLLSRWMPGLIGMTHLLVLGYLAMVMLGAMQQILPVLVGSPMPRDRLGSSLAFILLATGTPLLAWGLVFSQRLAIGLGGVLVVLSLLLFLIGATISLARSQARGPTHTSLCLAVSSLLITLCLGAWLASSHLSPDWPLPRHFTDIHLAWGLLGWMCLLISGVAYQVVPMFQMTPEYPRSLMRGFAPMVFVLLILFTFSSIFAADVGILRSIASALLALSLAALALSTLWLQYRRRRRNSDVTVWFWRIGMLALLGAMASWAAVQLLPWLQGRSSAPLLLAWFFLIGFVASIINGMLYKIVPFLVWLHLNTTRLQRRRFDVEVPNMHQVIPLRPARIQMSLHLLAVLLGLATLLLWKPLYSPTMLALAASNALLTINLLRAGAMFRKRMRALNTPPRRKPEGQTGSP